MERLGRDSDETWMEEVLVVLQPSALVLMAVGTLGLLANEFILAWGRPATCVFASVSILGLTASAP